MIYERNRNVQGSTRDITKEPEKAFYSKDGKVMNAFG